MVPNCPVTLNIDWSVFISYFVNRHKIEICGGGSLLKMVRYFVFIGIFVS